MDNASDSYRVRALNSKKRAKRFVSPDITKMFGLSIPDPTIAGKYTYYYFRTKSKRDKIIKRYPGAKEINPVKK